MASTSILRQAPNEIQPVRDPGSLPAPPKNKEKKSSSPCRRGRGPIEQTGHVAEATEVLFGPFSASAAKVSWRRDPAKLLPSPLFVPLSLRLPSSAAAAPFVQMLSRAACWLVAYWLAGWRAGELPTGSRGYWLAGPPTHHSRQPAGRALSWAFGLWPAPFPRQPRPQQASLP